MSWAADAALLKRNQFTKMMAKFWIVNPHYPGCEKRVCFGLHRSVMSARPAVHEALDVGLTSSGTQSYMRKESFGCGITRSFTVIAVKSKRFIGAFISADFSAGREICIDIYKSTFLFRKSHGFRLQLGNDDFSQEIFSFIWISFYVIFFGGIWKFKFPSREFLVQSGLIINSQFCG